MKAKKEGRKKGKKEAKAWGPIKVLGSSVEPGNSEVLMVPMMGPTKDATVDKRQLEFPAIVVRGIRPGPTLGVTGGIHGVRTQPI